jgi:hypothetical protein
MVFGGEKFGAADLLQGHPLVPVEFHGVHGDIQMSVENQAGL